MDSNIDFIYFATNFLASNGIAECDAGWYIDRAVKACGSVDAAYGYLIDNLHILIDAKQRDAPAASGGGVSIHGGLHIHFHGDVSIANREHTPIHEIPPICASSPIHETSPNCVICDEKIDTYLRTACCNSDTICNVCLARHIETYRHKTTSPTCPLCRSSDIEKVAYTDEDLMDKGIYVDTSLWVCSDCTTKNNSAFCSVCGPPADA